MASTEIGLDDPRQYVAGFGYCGAELDASPDAASVDCFIRGRRPALVTARWSGGTGARETMTRPDYTPVALQMMSAPYRLTLSRLRGSTPTRITLTAYEARAHVEQSVDAPGLLGGPSCSASNTSTSNTHGEQP